MNGKVKARTTMVDTKRELFEEFCVALVGLLTGVATGTVAFYLLDRFAW